MNNFVCQTTMIKFTKNILMFFLSHGSCTAISLDSSE